MFYHFLQMIKQEEIQKMLNKLCCNLDFLESRRFTETKNL